MTADTTEMTADTKMMSTLRLGSTRTDISYRRTRSNTLEISVKMLSGAAALRLSERTEVENVVFVKR